MNAFLQDERAHGELSIMLAVALAFCLLVVVVLLMGRFIAWVMLPGGPSGND